VGAKRQRPADPRADLARAVLAAAGRHGDALSCAVAAADAIASFACCGRASIGVHRNGEARLLAVSGESAPDRRRECVRALEVAMGTALAGGDGLRSLSDDVRALVHEAPSGVAVVAVLELDGKRKPLDRPIDDDRHRSEQAPWPALVAAIEPVLGLVGVLEHIERRARENPLERVRGALLPLERRGRRRRLFAVALLVPLLGAAVLVPLPYRVSARVSIEASDRQVMAVPHAGHLASAHVRAGDRVSAGQLLATLDARETTLALEKWDGEIASNRAERAMALAGRERVELARLRAEAERLAVERSLTEQRRARGEIRAPFHGVVLSGDPGRMLGAPLEAGETLFELASSERRSLLVEVDEHDVALIEPEAVAYVRMAAAPRRVLEAKLGEVVPIAVAEPGSSVFRVSATLADSGASASDAPVLRPGMEGVARIEAGRRSLVDAWTRTVRERLVLLGWKLGWLR